MWKRLNPRFELQLSLTTWGNSLSFQDVIVCLSYVWEVVIFVWNLKLSLLTKIKITDRSELHGTTLNQETLEIPSPRNLAQNRSLAPPSRRLVLEFWISKVSFRFSMVYTISEKLGWTRIEVAIRKLSQNLIEPDLKLQ